MSKVRRKEHLFDDLQTEKAFIYITASVRYVYR